MRKRMSQHLRERERESGRRERRQGFDQAAREREREREKRRERMLGRLTNGSGPAIPIPILGFGTASDPTPPHVVFNAISNAIQVGYRHFDTSSKYGSEGPLGEALAEAFQEGTVSRKDFFITSKLWCTDNYPDDVIPALRKTLSELQLEYLDLYLVHWPVRLKNAAPFPPRDEDDFAPLDLEGTWRAMEKCVEMGLAKAIGVSNFSCKKIEDMLKYATITPAVNQVEMHPQWQQKKLRECCKKANIHVSAYSPMGAPGTSWGSPEVLEHPIIKAIALRHGKTPAQVALRWGVEQGVSVLPKSYNKERIKANAQIFDWHLANEDHEKISHMGQRRIRHADFWCNDTTSPYKSVHELWDGEI